MTVESPVLKFKAPERTATGPATWLLAALALTLLWDMAGFDLPVMQWLGTAQGFALRDNWWLEQVLHNDLRLASMAFYLLMVLWALWPARWNMAAFEWLQLPRRERLGLVLLVALSLLAVNLVKMQSQTSCPWDLQAFGGRAIYVSHWNLGQADGGSGHCFPGGHASSAFGFIALCLPWLHPPGMRQRRREVGLRWLGVILLTGLVAGLVQTLRGAHYPSHTLWTLLICGTVSLAGWRLSQPWLARTAV